MKTKQFGPMQTHHKHLVFAGILTIFFLSGILVFANKFKAIAATDSYINNQTQDIYNTKILDFIQDDIHSQQAQVLLAQEKYTQALDKIQGEKSKDYFNRGVIFLHQAINKSKSTQVDTLQEAKYLAEKAIHNFEIAQKIQINNTLDAQIQENIYTAEHIYNFNTFKFCFAGNETLLDQLIVFNEDTKTILQLLESEEEFIMQNKKLLDGFTQGCEKKLTKINKSNYQQINKLKNILNIYQKKYTEQYIKALQTPTNCSGNNLDQTLSSLVPTKKTIKQYKEDHMQRLTALQNKNNTYLEMLCKESKNDSQLQSNISNTLEDFLKNLKQEITNDTNMQGHNNESQHQDIHTIDQGVQEHIQETNIKRIQKIQEIKKQKYNPSEQLKMLFKSFYGNTDHYSKYQKKKLEQ